MTYNESVAFAKDIIGMMDDLVREVGESHRTTAAVALGSLIVAQTYPEIPQNDAQEKIFKLVMELHPDANL